MLGSYYFNRNESKLWMMINIYQNILFLKKKKILFHDRKMDIYCLWTKDGIHLTKLDIYSVLISHLKYIYNQKDIKMLSETNFFLN